MIRLMLEEDAPALRKLVMAYLRETYNEGGDFPPTLENAAGFVAYGITGAKEGDPCLVVEDEETHKLVGFHISRGLFFPGMTTREITIRSWGSYVLPKYRGNGTVFKLIMVMGRLAKQKGYTQFLGFTHGSGYGEKAIKAAETIAGVREVGKVLMWRLAPPIENAI